MPFDAAQFVSAKQLPPDLVIDDLRYQRLGAGKQHRLDPPIACIGLGREFGISDEPEWF